MAKKIEPKTKKLEREYVIPLRKKWKLVPRYKRTNKAIKAIREFIVRHMKIRDRDLKKVKIDKYLNEIIWSRGIRKPPKKIKIKAIKEGEIVNVQAVEMPEKLKFKKLREEKREAEIAEKKKKLEEKKEEAKQKVEEEKEKAVKKEEEKEKKAAVVEAGKEMEKIEARKAKHEVSGKIKGPKKQFRKALEK